MKGIRFHLWSLDVASRAIGIPVDIYVTTSAGLTNSDDLQKMMDECAEEKQLKKKLTLSMAVEAFEFGNRWEAKMLRLHCESIDDIVAGLLQSVFGEHLFAAAGSESERLSWRNHILGIMSNIGYVSFDVLFQYCREFIRVCDGVQIWMAHDCDLGEGSGRSMLATGSLKNLEKMYKNLEQINLNSDIYGFSEDPSLPRWIELPLGEA